MPSVSKGGSFLSDFTQTSPSSHSMPDCPPQCPPFPTRSGTQCPLPRSQCEPAGQWTLGLIPRHSPPGCPSCADAKTKELKTQTPIATKPSPIHRSRQELALLAFCIGSLLDFPSGATNAIYARSYCCRTANCSLRKGRKSLDASFHLTSLPPTSA